MDFLIFISFFSKNLSGIPSVSNSLDPDQAKRFVGPDLGPNCLQRKYQQTTEVATGGERVNSKAPTAEDILIFLYIFFRENKR